MGTVKYTGSVASFHCPTNAEIRSLKVHFSPKQEGSGDPSPENVRPIVGWDGVEAYDWTSANVSALSIPSEYKKVEYLESTGTQYIYTNVPGRYGIECRAKVLWTSYGDTTIFGARKDSSDRIMLIHQYPNHKWTLGYGAAYTNLSQIDFNVIYDVESKVCSGEQYLRINGTTVYTGTDSAEYSNDFNLSLFACTYGSSNYCKLKASARIYSLNAKLDGIEVLNVVPCLRKSDNKPGMYDTVSQTFYTNAGTGEFLYGPEVSGYTEDYEFGVLGKNKLDASGFIDGEYVKSDGSIAQNSEFRRTDYLHLTPSDYVYSATKTDGTTAYVRVCGYDKSKTFVAQLGEQLKGSGNYEMTFTVPENVYYIILQSYKANTNEQLELGSSPTIYEPYNPNHTVYGGWVDLITGEVCEEWKTIDIGTLTWGSDPSKAHLYTANVPSDSETNNSNNLCICDTYKFLVASLGTIRTKSDKTIIYGRNGYRGIYLFDDEIEQASDMNTKLNNVILTYLLAVPNTYHLAPTQLQTFLGQNNVWSNADYVEVEYDLHETQTLLQRKAFIMANQPHIENASGAIASFSTDLKAPLKECKAYFSPMQEGTGDPSPDNVRPITGWTGIDVTHIKNLISYNDFMHDRYINDNGQEKTNASTMYSALVPVTSGVYTLAGTFVNGINMRFHAYNSQGEWVSMLAKIAYATAMFRTWDVMIPSGVPNIRVTAPDGTSDIMLFRKADSTTIPVDWTTEAGTVYGGYVDLVSGELVVKYSELSLGTDIIAQTITSQNNIYKIDCAINNSNKYINNNLNTIYCNICKPTTNTSSSNYTPWELGLYYSLYGHYRRLEIRIESETVLSSDSDVYSFLQNNGFKLIAQVSSYTNYTLTPTQLKTLRGQNNVWSNANGNIELKYWSH